MTSLIRHRAGRGPALVLLPGLGSDWRVWSPVIPGLIDRAEVVALDLPGLGRSADGLTHPSIDALASAVAGDLADAGVSEPLVVGGSLGGWIALELARRRTARAAVAVAPAGLAVGLERAYAVQSLLATRLAARLLGPARPLLARNPLFRAAFFAQTRARPWAVPAEIAAAELAVLAGAPAFNDVIGGVVARETASRLDEIDRPVLIIWGTRDRLLRPHQARRFLDRIPGARFTLLPGAGHIPMTDTPAALADLVLDFFELNERRMDRPPAGRDALGPA